MKEIEACLPDPSQPRTIEDNLKLAESIDGHEIQARNLKVLEVSTRVGGAVMCVSIVGAEIINVVEKITPPENIGLTLYSMMGTLVLAGFSGIGVSKFYGDKIKDKQNLVKKAAVQEQQALNGGVPAWTMHS